MRNIGTYRMQVFDGRSTGMHWQRHKGGAQHYRIAERMGKRLEVAVALGADPALPFAATAPMPEGLDELLLAGFLRRDRVELVKCVTVDLEVPASSQIVLEGYVEPGERRREGPFGDHTGFYSHADDYPVFPHHLRDAAQEPDLPHDRRRHPSDGGSLSRQGERADLPAAHQEDGARRSST
jgi:4-hydroxy-3-polyprenylbenzoate decarboxylase